MTADPHHTNARLRLTRSQLLRYRLQVGGLCERSTRTADAIRLAARIGLTDSMPRAAVLSLHARVAGVTPDVLDEPTLVQVWGPRYSVYVVDERDVAPFTLGRLPTDARGLARAEDIATGLRELLAGRVATDMSEAGRELGIHPNALRYASPTGTIRIRWDGARRPTVTVVRPPAVEPRDARHELVRRYLHTVGPATPSSFANWAGITLGTAATTFAELAEELLPVRTPIGDAFLLAADEAAMRAADVEPAEGVRVLPSGDAYWLLWGDDRALLVGDDTRRSELWTTRVWPGALLIDGEIVGIWRRAKATATVSPWRRLTATQRADVEAEFASLPLPDPDAPVGVVWAG